MKNLKSRAVCYIRSDEWSQLREQQLSEICSYTQDNNIEVLKIFEDANNDLAPSLGTALSFAELHRADFFILWRMDRAGEQGRSIGKAVNMISDLNASEVTFISLRDQIHSGQSADLFLRSLVRAVACAARLIKGERVRHALKTARTLGEPIGRPTSRDDEKILQLRKQGFSLREIAGQTGVSIWAVQRAIKGSPKQDKGPNAQR